MIKIYFRNDSYWTDNGCDCCSPDYWENYNFSHILNDLDRDINLSNDLIEMNNGSKSEKEECLVSVLWDVLGDLTNGEDYYDFLNYYLDKDDCFEVVTQMLNEVNVEVFFLED